MEEARQYSVVKEKGLSSGSAFSVPTDDAGRDYLKGRVSSMRFISGVAIAPIIISVGSLSWLHAVDSLVAKMMLTLGIGSCSFAAIFFFLSYLTSVLDLDQFYKWRMDGNKDAYECVDVFGNLDDRMQDALIAISLILVCIGYLAFLALIFMVVWL